MGYFILLSRHYSVFERSSYSVRFKSAVLKSVYGQAVALFKEVRHIEMPKAAPKVHLSFSKTKDDIERK